MLVREWNYPLVMRALDTPFDVVGTKEEVHGLFTIQFDDLRDIFLLGDCHLSLTLFCKSLKKVGIMSNLPIHLGLLMRVKRPLL